MKETAAIKVFDNVGAEVPMQYLKDVIHKYEKGDNFFLRIELMDSSGEESSSHAFVLMKVRNQVGIEKSSNKI